MLDTPARCFAYGKNYIKSHCYKLLGCFDRQIAVTHHVSSEKMARELNLFVSSGSHVDKDIKVVLFPYVYFLVDAPDGHRYMLVVERTGVGKFLCDGLSLPEFTKRSHTADPTMFRNWFYAFYESSFEGFDYIESIKSDPANLDRIADAFASSSLLLDPISHKLIRSHWIPEAWFHKNPDCCPSLD